MKVNAVKRVPLVLFWQYIIDNREKETYVSIILEMPTSGGYIHKSMIDDRMIDDRMIE